MIKRPTSVTSVAWITILLNALIFTAALHSSISFATISSIMLIVTAFFILKGRPWSRWLYIAIVAFKIISTLYMPHLSSSKDGLLTLGVAAAIPDLIMIGFLFTKKANAFFASKG